MCICVLCSRLCGEPTEAGRDSLLQGAWERPGPGEPAAQRQRHERKYLEETTIIIIQVREKNELQGEIKSNKYKALVLLI